MKINNFFHKYLAEIVALTIGLFFGTYVMFSTFAKNENTLFFATKVWSDFASHIPLIRSFSLGSNIPPEYPLFAGPAIKYHFGFYFGVGYLEKIGFPIDLALNIPSAIGFMLLVFMIYYFSKVLFKSKAVGFLSILFFLFNSSLSFIYYFQKNPISIQSIYNIPKITNFQSFAPYGDGVISAFWNLNIYTNQRHLPLSFTISLLIIYFFIKPLLDKSKINLKLSIILGFILGLTFLLHFAVLLMTASTIFFLGLLFSKLRKSAFILLFVGAIISLPQYLYISSSGESSIFINIGYLVANELNAYSFVEFWLLNLGLSIILIPLGFAFANSLQRKILLSFIPLLIIANTLQFSPEIAANHKFFNYFLIIGNMYSAFALFILWKKKSFLKPVVIIALFFMILGGIIDIFPIINDKKVAIADYEINPRAKWIHTNTSKDSVFLNTTYLYNPASVSGRNVFFGWPYFAWSQGYDTEGRRNIYSEILGSTSKEKACNLLRSNNINYVEINYEEAENPDIPEISEVWKEEFITSYNENESYNIYNVRINCN